MSNVLTPRDPAESKFRRRPSPNGNHEFRRWINPHDLPERIMRRAPPTLAVPSKLLQHFAALTVTLTAGIAMFASSENRQAAQESQARPKPEAAAEEEQHGGGISAMFGGAEAEALNSAHKKQESPPKEIGGLKIGKNTRLANNADWGEDSGPSPDGGGSFEGGSDSGGYYSSPPPAPPRPYAPGPAQAAPGQPDRPSNDPPGPGGRHGRPNANGPAAAKAAARPRAPTAAQIENLLAASRERASRSGNGSAAGAGDE